MAAVELVLFADLTTRQLVRSLTDSSPFAFPSLFQEDRVRMDITCVRASAGNPYAPFAKVTPHSGLTMVCKIAKTNGTILAAGTSSYSAATDTLTLTLECNTGAMVTAMSGQTQISAIIEFELDDGDNAITAHQSTISIFKEYITAASAAPSPIDTYLTEAQSNSRFVRKLGAAGEAITLVSSDGTKQVLLYCADDGSFHADAI